jgi:ABC-type branched-subunit amino acid transport system ATPase component
MVLVEQNASILVDLVDEVLLMRNGRVFHRGAADDLRRSGALGDVLLGRLSESDERDG